MRKKSVTVIYDEISEWFDQARDKSLKERGLLEYVLQAVKPEPKVLDLGCGSGQPIADFLIERGADVTGVDGAENMIALCQQRYPEHSWLKFDMRQIDLDQQFDVVLCWDSFFHLTCDDQRAMFDVFQKHLRPSGCLMFSCGSVEGEAWSPMYGKDDVQMFHASLNTQEYINLLEQNGFEILRDAQNDADCGGRAYFIARKL